MALLAVTDIWEVQGSPSLSTPVWFPLDSFHAGQGRSAVQVADLLTVELTLPKIFPASNSKHPTPGPGPRASHYLAPTMSWFLEGSRVSWEKSRAPG